MLDGLKGSCCFLCMFCFFGFYTFPVTFEGCLHGHLCYKQLSVRITPEKKEYPESAERIRRGLFGSRRASSPPLMTDYVLPNSSCGHRQCQHGVLTPLNLHSSTGSDMPSISPCGF